MVGTLTNELLGLGDADADALWIGIRRHQAVLAVAGVGVVADWLFRPRASVVELLFGVALFAGTVPVVDGHTIGERSAIALRYFLRSRWSTTYMVEVDDCLEIQARGRVAFRAFQLDHRGRLDLSGRDATVAYGLAALVDGIGVGGPSRHVSVHVQSPGAGAATLLSLPEATMKPEGWHANTQLAFEIAAMQPQRPTMLLERWRYVRTAEGLAATLRIRDFSATPKGRALLERLQLSTGQLTLAVHADVVAGSRAKRVAERAVHRSRSDGAASLAAGFRRTARVEGHFERLAQRETLVASGRALLRIAVFATVRGDTYDELRSSVDEVTRAARDSGLRCDRGVGRQTEWYCFQLPGGPGW